MNRTKTLRRWIGLGAAVISLPFLLCVIPMLWGWSSYVVLTGSMGEAVPVGSVAVIGPVAQAEVATGDIVLFRYKQANVLHRVTGFGDPEEPWSVYTQGDRNSKGEPIQVAYGDIRGQYLYNVPYLGYPVQWIQANGLLLAGLALAGWWWVRKTRQERDKMN